MNKLIGLVSASMLGLPLAVSAAVDGRICFETKTSAIGSPIVYSDYTITFQKGEVATVAGQTCFKHPYQQVDECLASSGSMHFHNGVMEIDVNGSNKINVPGLGDVYSFAQSYTELDSISLEGHGASLTTNVVNGEPSTTFSTDGVAIAVACQKPTAQDKENIKLRNKMLRDLDKL